MTPDPTLDALWARILSGRYHRHFGGRDRGTRDLLELDEIALALEPVAGRLKGSDRDSALRQLEILRTERPKIVEAQSRGSNEERVSRLATRANDQFAIYRQVFAGQERASREPQLLRRMVAALRRISGEMEGLRSAGVKSEQNDKNLGIVAARIADWDTEIAAIESTQTELGEKLPSYLARAANAVFQAYRDEFQGKSRAASDPDRLHVLCELLHPIARRMGRVEGDDPTNAQNIRHVVEHLDLYEREVSLIVQARLASRAGIA
jgi:hypothetical protein